MQLRHLKTIHPPQEGVAKVTAICWSPNNRRAAIVTTDRVVHLFDENGDRRDKFSTKPADAARARGYTVRGMAWSPDSSKLAIAQSDNIVFVYKLGTEWGDRKSICNKFNQSSSITCVCWPKEHPHEVVFGLAEGKVKVGQLRSNKPLTLYATDSYVVSCCARLDGGGVLSGHLDGSVVRFLFDESGRGAVQAQVCTHTCVPYALSWGEAICCAGSDQKVLFYDAEGTVLQAFDCADDEGQREFTVAAFNPSGEAVVVGSFDRFHTFAFNARASAWEQVGLKAVENLYTVTALGWNADGSRLAVGSLCGGVELYDACVKREVYRGKFEFTYVSLSAVIVKRLSTGARIVLKSHFGLEVAKVNVYNDRYLIAHTAETLLMGDLDTCKLSEVPWRASAKEKFLFDNERVCVICTQAELTIVEYGRNEVLGSCRTEHMNPHQLSVKVRGAGGAEVKKVAYLIDLQTIRVLDLENGVPAATISHDARIDWLDLSLAGTKLLFRDKRRQLHLYDVQAQARTTLLAYASYVNWVPGADVIVAQNRGSLCVWYHVDSPDRVTVVPINGEVEEIERADGKTEVIVDEGINTVSYALDEALIAFGAALDAGELEGAAATLAQLELTPETEAMWGQLSLAALAAEELAIAERCFAAVGDAAKARYLHKVVNLMAQLQAETGQPALAHFRVQARLAVLGRQYKRAELLLLQHGQVEDAMEMWQELHKWDESIAVAEANHHPAVQQLKANYVEWLLQTRQEEKAALLEEREGRYAQAVQLYLKGGLPAKAARLALQLLEAGEAEPQTLEAIAAALSRAGMHEKAGGFYEQLGDAERALDAYRRGSAFGAAVELCRRAFDGRGVAELEAAWGDHLVAARQTDAAVNHYVEAGAYAQAVEAAVASRQWAKAAQVAQQLQPKQAAPYYARIAAHFEQAGALDEAEAYHVRGGSPGAAVEMRLRAGQLERAQQLAGAHLTKQEMGTLCMKAAHRLEGAAKLRDAERLYLLVHEPDLAINMYKKARRFEDMVRLVGSHRQELLHETFLHLGQQLEADGSHRQAEEYYARASDWKSAVNMYRANDLWDDAIRVAKEHGGVGASKQVAYAWAVSLGGEAGARLLTKFGLIEQAIDYAVESGAFEHAFELARASLKSKLPEVHLKFAMSLEDEGRFAEAEASFVSAGKPKEAIDMYVHQQDWASAMRVAETCDPSSLADVLVAQARAAVERKDWPRAEALFVRAKRPELAVGALKDAGRWQDAVRLTKEFLPHKLQEVNADYARFQRGEYVPSAQPGAAGGGGSGGGPGGAGAAAAKQMVAGARALEEGRDFSKAIDAYLRVTTEHSGSHELLEAAWEGAVKLAMSHVPGRTAEVVGVVAGRLVAIGRATQAAELLEGTGAYRQALEVHMAAGQWEQARALYRAQAPQLAELVEGRYVAALQGERRADDLVLAGKASEGLDAYAQRGDWAKALEVAQLQGPAMVLKYATLHGSVLTNQSDFLGAARVFGTYGTDVAKPALVALYRRLATQLLAERPESSAHAEARAELRELRAMLVKAIGAMRAAGEAPHVVAEFERLLWVATLHAGRALAAQQGHKLSALKLALALLRHLADVPADKAFHDAGLAAKGAGRLGIAFVLLNRYLDISEAIEDGHAHARLDSAQFEGTEIPSELAIPDKNYLSDSEREKVRDYVLELSMNTGVEQTLPAHEVAAIFREADAARDALFADAVDGERARRQRPPYGPSDGDMQAILVAAIAQV